MRDVAGAESKNGMLLRTQSSWQDDAETFREAGNEVCRAAEECPDRSGARTGRTADGTAGRRPALNE